MASKITDLLPTPVEVKVAEGKPPLVLRHLELNEIVTLLIRYQDEFVALYVQSQKGGTDYASFLTLAPQMCADAISMSAGEPDECDSYRKLPFSVQLIALEKLWTISVPDPKSLGETLRKLMNELKRLSEMADKAQKEVPDSAQAQATSSVSS